MKRAVVVLDIGGKSFLPRCRETVDAACKRWGSDLIVIDRPIVKNVHPYWQKTFAIERLGDYEQVAQIDGDMMVRIDCPSLFDAVPVNSLGVVSEHQDDWKKLHQWRQRAIDDWSKRTGLPRVPMIRNINGGLIVYSPQHHDALFREWQEIGRKCKFLVKQFPEQTTLALLVGSKPDLDVTWLPRQFNRIGSRHIAPLHTPPYMKSYVYHLTGTGPVRMSKEDASHAVWWRCAEEDVKAPYTDEIARRIPSGRETRGVEVGVYAGVNARGLLQNCPGLHLTLVDLWKNFGQESPGSPFGELQDDDWRMIMSEALGHLENYHGRFSVLQGDSAKMARAIDDQSQDFVFIDSTHTEEGCHRDIMAWLPKVRNGGWIGGHDYRSPGRPEWGVDRAVARAFPGKNIETGSENTWFTTIQS